VVDAAGGYPVTSGFELFIERVDRCHLVSWCAVCLVVDYKNDESQLSVSSQTFLANNKRPTAPNLTVPRETFTGVAG
jgi:hypothetical protein